MKKHARRGFGFRNASRLLFNQLSHAWRDPQINRIYDGCLTKGCVMTSMRSPSRSHGFCKRHARMQALERRRLKRMRGADESEGSDDDLEAPGGGFAKRRFQAAQAEAESDGKAARCTSFLGCAIQVAACA